MKPTPITHSLSREITNDVFDRKLGQVASFVAGALVLVLSLGKLTRLELTEEQLFFGVLISLVVPLLLVVIGLLLPISTAAKRAA
jgi:hypothetical protein